MSDFLCTLPVIAGLLGICAPSTPMATGYVEGEYVLIAPVETARISDLAVRRGDRVSAGQTLAMLETADALIAVRQAEAALEQTRSQLENLKLGRRPEELAVIEASLVSAKAQADEALKVYQRQKDLLGRGIAPQSSYDQAASTLSQTQALVQQITANLEVARLPARPGEIDAAEATVKQARATLDNANWRLENRKLSAPSTGVVYDIIRRIGEVAGPSQPAVSLLPDGAVKLRLYAAEKYISSIALGTVLSVRCDGCRADMTAKVTYVSDSPEFTPPVIYSLENRQKLVYLVEARPDSQAEQLKPGQIVDVVLGDAGK